MPGQPRRWRDRGGGRLPFERRRQRLPLRPGRSPIRGASACSINTPLKVSGALGGKVAVIADRDHRLPAHRCTRPLAANSVQPAAYRQFGSQVVGIRQIASYSCRGRNGSRRGHLSEHAYGNAIDIAAFRLANGQEITVVKGWWRGTSRERAFLREVFAGACSEFYTVLGPGSDRYHYNHIHVDLLVSNASRGRHYCRPSPGRGGADGARPERRGRDCLRRAHPLHGPERPLMQKTAHCGSLATSRRQTGV